MYLDNIHGGGSGGGLVAKSCPTLATPWTIARQAPLSTGFSRQEHWSGLPFQHNIAKAAPPPPFSKVFNQNIVKWRDLSLTARVKIPPLPLTSWVTSAMCLNYTSPCFLK